VLMAGTTIWPPSNSRVIAAFAFLLNVSSPLTHHTSV
jgi:hypothetical protein